jgi:HSP20 family protein
VTLMRSDPFRELDRLTERAISRAARPMPMEALRRGDEFFVYLDLPGVDPDDVDVTVEKNTVSIRARRMPRRGEGDEVIVDERTYGEFTRQLFLGDNLDPDGLTADLADGVLTLRIPVSEASKPRRVALASSEREGDSTERGDAPSERDDAPAAATSSSR